MISVVLIKPEHPGNVGAIARVMANFGINNLFIIEPRCDHLDQEARNRAKHAQSVLQKAKIIKKSELKKKFDTLIATTAKLGRDYNIPRSPITPSQLGEILPERSKAALVFGPEGEGLSNEEVQMCGFTITIPTPGKYKALNLSHAVSVILYELTKKESERSLARFAPASSKEKDLILKIMDERMKKMDFKNNDKRQTQLKVWKKMISKSFLSKREAFALLGFLKKI